MHAGVSNATFVLETGVIRRCLLRQSGCCGSRERVVEGVLQAGNVFLEDRFLRLGVAVRKQ